MNLLQWLSDRWEREAGHSPYWKRPTEPPIIANAGEHYFRLSVSEMFLKNDREWFSAWQPAVYVALRFRFGDKDEQFNHVAGPSSLGDFDAGRLNQDVSVNLAITPLLPFNGGQIEIEAGLVAVKGADDVKTLLKVLGDFSKVLAVPQLSSALGFAAPLADGISDLLGVKGNRSVLRLRDAFSKPANPLQSQFLVIVGATDGELDETKISMEAGRLRYRGQALTGYNYMVLRVDTPTERDDYESLSSIEDPFLQAIDALKDAVKQRDPKRREEMLADADNLLLNAKFAVYQSKELTKVVGRNQVIKAIEAKYAQAKVDFGAPGLVEDQTTIDLKSIMASSITVRDARSLGELRILDLLKL